MLFHSVIYGQILCWGPEMVDVLPLACIGLLISLTKERKDTSTGTFNFVLRQQK